MTFKRLRFVTFDVNLAQIWLKPDNPDNPVVYISISMWQESLDVCLIKVSNACFLAKLTCSTLILS